MAMGSPIGAIRVSFTRSPGVQPISKNLRAITLSVKESTMALSPNFNCDKFILMLQRYRLITSLRNDISTLKRVFLD